MEVIRISRKIADFTCIDNGISKDPDLSLQERGLMLTVLSLPESWEFNIQGLATIVRESKPTLAKIIHALMAHGYCKRERIIDPQTKRVIKWEYTFYEVKNGNGCDFEPQSKKPQVENPQCGVATSGNLSTIKYYKESNTNKSNNKRESVFTPPTLEEVRNHWRKYPTMISDPDHFYIYFDEADWRYKNGRKMKDWRKAALMWEKNERKYGK